MKVYLPDETQRRRIRRADGMAVGTLDDSYRRADDSDQKRQIRQTPLFKLDLSTMQQTKVNAFAPIDMEEALTWLTPDQRTRFEALRGRFGGSR